MTTCLYRGKNVGDFWSNQTAMLMSVEEPAGALVANLLEGMKFGLGPTIAVRKEALEKIGGEGKVLEFFGERFYSGQPDPQGGIPGGAFRPRDRSHREPEHVPENAAEPVAVESDGAVLPAEGLSGHGADLCDAVRDSGIAGRGIVGTLGLGSGLAGVGGGEPVDHGVCGGMDGVARPAAAAEDLALSHAGFAGIYCVVHEFRRNEDCLAEQPV